MPFTHESDCFPMSALSSATATPASSRDAAAGHAEPEHLPAGVRQLRIRAQEEAWVLHAAHANGFGASEASGGG